MVRVAGCTLRSRARSHVTEDYPQPHRTAPSARSRRAAEGPHATPSSDGCAAPLAASGSGEHARDVLSTPSARPEVESSRKAVVPRERRWLVAEWNGRAARAARGSRRRAGAAAGARHGRLQASQAPSGVPRNSYRPWGHQGPLGGAVGALEVRATVEMNVYDRYTHTTSPCDAAQKSKVILAQLGIEPGYTVHGKGVKVQSDPTSAVP